MSGLRRMLPRCGLAALAIVLFCLPAAGQEGSPRAVVEGLHATLLDTMKRAESLGIKGRYRNLEPTVRKVFHLRLMIAVASGQYWRKAARADRESLARAFERFSVGTYASRFSSYTGESFETASVKPGPRGTMLVNTRIVRKNEPAVRITYVVKQFDKRWRIVDVVVAGGISELAVRRSEYSKTLKQGGVGALIAALDEKTEGLLVN